MIIEGHAHITDIPEPVWSWPPYPGDRLVREMDGPYPIAGRQRRIDKAVVMPALGATTLADWDFYKQHRHVIESVKKYPDRLIGNMVINPRFGVQKGVEVLRDLVKNHGFRMVKLHPTMHHYWPNKSIHLVAPIVEEAIALNIPVLIHTGEPPYSVPSLMAPIAESFPKAKIILAHMGTQKVCYADEVIYLARKNDNIYLETGWGVQPRLIEAVSELGASKLTFGTDVPPLEMYSQLRVVEILTWAPPLGVNLNEKDLEAIMGDNLAQLMGLER